MANLHDNIQVYFLYKGKKYWRFAEKEKEGSLKRATVQKCKSLTSDYQDREDLLTWLACKVEQIHPVKRQGQNWAGSGRRKRYRSSWSWELKKWYNAPFHCPPQDMEEEPRVAAVGGGFCFRASCQPIIMKSHEISSQCSTWEWPGFWMNVSKLYVW